ncbi:putative carbonic anhydrase 3 [Hyalella azteca]|uniref:Carbonic anhydrase n=1 Tax=Hyalella azteca TaxID=294128 RepID=A0A979FJS9_HYAAZ|nr:putative carbonic anhydrase 3 [Hyalella azteca]
MISSVIFLFILLLAVREGNPSVPWDYETKEDWPRQFPLFCAGKRQSPINIDRFSVQYSHWVGIYPIYFYNYEVIPEQQIAINNGEQLQVMHNSKVPPSIKGGGLHGTYLLSQYHFHWGSDSSKGSEHTINTVRYPMELHLVHYKAQYGDMMNALRYADGVAVLAVLFEVSSRDNPALAPVLQQVQNIRRGRGTPMTPVNAPYAVASLLPDDTKSFYRYEGSLTSPPCNEVVIWTVFKEPVHVSQNQLELMRTLLDLHDEPIEDNFRNPQPLNNRRVYRSFFKW